MIKNPTSITKIIIHQHGKPNIEFKFRNSLIYKALNDNLTKTALGYRVIYAIAKQFQYGFAINCEVTFSGKARRDDVFLQTRFFKKLADRMNAGPPTIVDRDIPIYCECCVKYTPETCKENFHKQAYMTARTILTAIPLPEIDNYDDLNEIRDRDEAERGGG